MREIKIIDIIGTPNAILHNFGLKIYDVLKPYISQNIPVVLSFDSMKNVTSGFCNASIGKIYSEFRNASSLLNIKGAEHNSIWQEKIQDSITLATNPDKIRLQDEAVSDLLYS
jgi:hypothetical protein